MLLQNDDGTTSVYAPPQAIGGSGSDLDDQPLPQAPATTADDSDQPVMAIGGALQQQQPGPTPTPTVDPFGAVQASSTPLPQPPPGETPPPPPPPDQTDQTPTPPPAQSDQRIDLKGAPGQTTGVGSDPDLPSHLPRMEPPAQRYNDLKTDNPQLYDDINKVADMTGVPRRDLAAIVYASSDNNPAAASRDGRLGLAGITSEDRNWVDPTHSMDPNDPLANLMMGAEKYKRLSQRFGRGTPEVYAAYFQGPDQTEALLRRHPEDHQEAAQPGTFDFINKVLGRGQFKYTGPQDQGTPTTDPLGTTQATGPETPPPAPPQFPNAPTPDTTGSPAALRQGLTAPFTAIGNALQNEGITVTTAPSEIGPVVDIKGAPQAIESAIGKLTGYITGQSGAGTVGGSAQGNVVEVTGTPGASVKTQVSTPPPPAPGAPTGTLTRGGQSTPAGAPPAPTPAPPPTPAPTPGTLAVGGALIPGAQAATPPPAAPTPPPQAIPPIARVNLPTPNIPPPEIAPTTGGGAPPPAPSASQGNVGRDQETQETEAPPVNRNMTAVGDSYAAGAIRNGLQGTEAPFKGGENLPGNARVGAPTSEVLRRVQALPDQTGKDVVLSTGILNTGDKKAAMADVEKQVNTLLNDKHANSVTILGGPIGARYGQNNQLIEDYVNGLDNSKVRFQGGVTHVNPNDPDQLHPRNYAEYLGLDGATGGATTGSGQRTAGGTTAPAVGTGGGTGAPAAPTSPPAGAPGAIGATPASTASSEPPPVTKLNQGPSTITPQGVVRANAGGSPNSVLTYITGNARPGSSMGQSWDQVNDAMERYFLLKGDIEGAMHAREYVFQLQHEGAFMNLSSGYKRMMAGDYQGAAADIARSHAFAPDGSAMGIQVTGTPGNYQMWGQRVSEDTHQPIGQPFQITPDGVRGMLMQTNDPRTFLTMVNTERTTNNTIEHDRWAERHGDTQLQIEQEHYNQQAENYRQRTIAQQQNAQLAAQQRAANQQQNRDIAAAQDTASRRAAITKEATAAYPMDDTTAVTPPTDINGQPLTPQQRVQGQDAYTALRMNNNSLGPNAAQDIVKSLLAPDGTKGKRYTATPVTSPKGEAYFGIKDLQGNFVAYVPQADLRTLFSNPNQTRQEKARSNL